MNVELGSQTADWIERNRHSDTSVDVFVRRAVREYLIRNSTHRFKMFAGFSVLNNPVAVCGASWPGIATATDEAQVTCVECLTGEKVYW